MNLRKVFFLLCVVSLFWIKDAVAQDMENDMLEILQQIKSSIVTASIVKDGHLYENPDDKSSIVANISVYENVEILEDKTTIWYRVCNIMTGEIGWIQREFLNIPLDEPSNKVALKQEHIEKFANILQIKPETKKLVWVDIDRQLVYILEKDKDGFKLSKTIPCSTGKNESPTLRGFFNIQERGVWFYSERLKSGAKFWVRFHESYLFHSIPMNMSKQVIDNTIGEKSSSGCVRLNLEDAEWFYNNVEDGVLVFIN